MPWTEAHLFSFDSIGPVAQFHENSTYYSAVEPLSNQEVDSNLPHVTIEMPVYKESLKETMCVRQQITHFIENLPIVLTVPHRFTPSKRLCRPMLVKVALPQSLFMTMVCN